MVSRDSSHEPGSAYGIQENVDKSCCVCILVSMALMSITSNKELDVNSGPYCATLLYHLDNNAIIGLLCDAYEGQHVALELNLPPCFTDSSYEGRKNGISSNAPQPFILNLHAQLRRFLIDGQHSAMIMLTHTPVILALLFDEQQDVVTMNTPRQVASMDGKLEWRINLSFNLCLPRNRDSTGLFRNKSGPNVKQGFASDVDCIGPLRSMSDDDTMQDVTRKADYWLAELSSSLIHCTQTLQFGKWIACCTLDSHLQPVFCKGTLASE